MSKEEIPKFKVLGSIEPEETEKGLHSPDLEKNLEEYRNYETKLWNEFLSAEEGSSEEEACAKQLAELYFLETANKQQLSPEKALWSERFNELVGELYGEPELNEAAVLAERELNELPDDENVREVYEKISSHRNEELSGEQVYEKLDTEQFEAMREGLQEHYSAVLAVLEEHRHEGKYSAEENAGIFQEIIDVLSEFSAEWSEWTVKPTKGSSRVAPEDKIVYVSALKDFSAVQRIAMHELGVHAARGVAGYEKEDEYLAFKGLPGYGRAEEGLGVLFEYLISTEVPDRIKDRYIDAAIAFGVIPDVQMSREELIEFATNRTTARKKQQEVDVDEKKIQSYRKNATKHVNRLFRGGDGNIHETATGLTQSVFVKDIVYYLGFAEVEDFVKKQLDEGKDPKEVIEFLLQGKFDPTNEKHLEYLESK